MKKTFFITIILLFSTFCFAESSWLSVSSIEEISFFNDGHLKESDFKFYRITGVYPYADSYMIEFTYNETDDISGYEHWTFKFYVGEYPVKYYIYEETWKDLPVTEWYYTIYEAKIVDVYENNFKVEYKAVSDHIPWSDFRD